MKNDPTYKIPGEYQQLNSHFSYYLSKSELRIYFSSELKKQLQNSFQLRYPRFSGNLIPEDGRIRMSGEIGLQLLTYIFPSLSFIAFLLIGLNWAFSSADNGQFTLYIALFVLVTGIISLTRTRTKVDEMKKKIAGLFEKTQTNMV